MQKWVNVEKVEPVNLNDQRGPIYEWKFPDGKQQITIVIRKKGSNSNHFHKGEDPSKNPERLFIVQGKIKARFISPDGQVTETILERGNIVTVFPPTKHSMEALEDAILIESRSTYFDPNHPDTYPC